MRRGRILTLATVAFAAVLWTYACGDGGTEPPPPDPPRPTTVTVTPSAAQLAALEATVQLAAEVRDQYGNVMANASVSWSSSEVAVAAVDGAGLVTAAGNGAATITATSGQASGTAAVTVAQVVAAVAVTPEADTLVEADTLRFTAEASDANGHALEAAEFAWSSGDTLVAVVDTSGLVTGIAPGVADVTATTSGVSGASSLTIAAAVPTTVAVTPDTVAFTAIGQSEQLTAEVRDQIGRVMENEAVSWSSGDTAVAVVDAGGVVTAGGGGIVTITAGAGEASGAGVVTVVQVAGSVVVSPAADTISMGDTLTLAAEAFDANGYLVGGAEFSWSSSDGAVAEVGGGGMVRGVTQGTVTITATAGDAQGTSEITVENPDRAILELFYGATDGPNWVDSENWLTDAPLSEWYGVSTDASGRVVGLQLSGRWDDAARVDVSQGLAGPIPLELGRLDKLETLDLSINGLTGTIPAEFADLANLRELSLSRNSLRGVVPPELGDLEKLEVLNLRWNLLKGTIPPTLGRLANLRNLRLQNNELTGPIPPELRGLTSLRRLELRYNKLTGPIPPWLGELTGLQSLSLGGNHLHGPVPAELGNLVSLLYLLLDENNLSGPIPPQLGRLTDLRWLYLYDNNLTGTIPAELGSLPRLQVLSLWGNKLIGRIPSELGNLSELDGLLLEENNLTGRVPAELGRLQRLRSITLSGNQLTGSLPLNFVELDSIESFGCRFSLGVCVPATDEFREWVRQVDARGNFALRGVDVPFCDKIDRDALKALHEAADGADWKMSDGWLDDENLGQWHGVRTDSIGRVSGLDLTGNGLSGYVPEAMGLLAGLTDLRIAENALSGRLPLSLADLPLEELDYRETSLCVPDDAGFRAWLGTIPRHSGTGVQCPPLTDREILEHVYRNTDGRNWHRSAGWLTEAPLARWQGVETDTTGRVVGLRLRGNGLSGSLVAELGQLSELRELDLHGNELSGSIPPELGDLAKLTRLKMSRNALGGDIPAVFGQLSELRQLSLYGNELSGSIPPELGDLAKLHWLDLSENELTGAIPVELGNLASLFDLRLDDNLLSGQVPQELGSLTSLVALDLANNGLVGSIPADLGGADAMETLSLSGNQLSGVVPPQLGALDRLVELDLSGNQLSGPIPSELGGLPDLAELQLSGNGISGSIPAELGRSLNLSLLELADNRLTGWIPPELGDLANLVTLDLGDNELSGSLPAELGRAVLLEDLDLRSNQFAGPTPPGFGNLTLLKSLILADNPELVGPLPMEIMGIEGLERLMAGGTGLCWPPNAAYAAWFRRIPDRRLVRCEGGATVYLTQTLQSWDDPVPLLAGEPALLRVFVTAPEEAKATMPDVRATFYVDGTERHSVHIAATTQPIPSEIMEGNLAHSANAEIPEWLVVPGLEMVIEVDPEETLDSSLGVTKRIPESGRMAVDVRTLPPLHLTLIPFLNENEPDSTALEDVSAMAADPDGHELLRDVRTLLPIVELAIAAREPVIVSTPDVRSMLTQVAAIRLMENGSGYWMGVWDGVLNEGTIPAARGVAQLGGMASVSVRFAPTIAHELGHNLSLRHAPCGRPAQVDPWFPHADGRIGAWGYDFARNSLVPPDAPDMMSYCRFGIHWISDFFFNKALDHRLANDGAASAGLATSAERVRTLLLWGGRDQDGVAYLDPAFVVDAVPSLPAAGGDHTIMGTTTDGTPLFSHTFAMPDIGDAEGEESSFVFTLPLEDGWADDLAAITLSGPGGSVTLDGDSDLSMAILRDPRTGQVRGFLSDLPAAIEAAADSAVPGAPSLEVLFSRGIPSAEAWRR